jgi:hypothetical protein
MGLRRLTDTGTLPVTDKPRTLPVPLGRMKLFVSVLIALSIGAIVGSLCLGVLLGLPGKVIATIQFYFPVVAVLTLLVGSLLYAGLKSFRMPITLVVCLVSGAIIACLPLVLLVAGEVMRPGPMALEQTKDLALYSAAVIASGAVGGGAFFVAATLLRCR